MKAVDRLYILVSDGDPLARRYIGRFLAGSEDRDAKARALGALAAYHVGKGQLTEALQAIREGLAAVRSPVGLVELVLGRSAIALNCGEPSYARALTDRSLLETHDGPDEARAIALFGSAVASAYCGELEKARRRWRRSLELTERPLYAANARTNLALLEIERRRLGEAETLLAEPFQVATRTLRGLRCIGFARIAAIRNEYESAAEHQSAALEWLAHRGAADRAEVAVSLVDYLFRAGRRGAACEAAQAIGALVLEMDDQRHELAAASLTELVCAGAAAGLSQGLIENCAASLSRLNRGDHPVRSRDPRDPRSKALPNPMHRRSIPA